MTTQTIKFGEFTSKKVYAKRFNVGSKIEQAVKGQDGYEFPFKHEYANIERGSVYVILPNSATVEVVYEYQPTGERGFNGARMQELTLEVRYMGRSYDFAINKLGVGTFRKLFKEIEKQFEADGYEVE